jgi:tripartite-type tricarboxylate transporter receptor subunit TctC
MNLGRPLLVALAALSLSGLAGAQAWAQSSVQSSAQTSVQTWPDRPIKLISSQAAGGATDLIGRLVADQLAARLGQPIVYENRPGGGNVIGTQAAARSGADGYTFFFASAAALVTDPYTYKSLPYDPMKDFEVISSIAEVSFMLLAHPSVPAQTLPEMLAYARSEPGKLAVATDGQRRFSGMIAAWINKLAGTTMSYVPYVQMTQGVQDALAGRVQLIILGVPSARGHIASGGLRPLAVTSARRLGDFDAVPAVSETFPGFDFTGWWVMAAPTGVPAAILARMNRELDVILKDPAVVERMSKAGFVSRGGGTMQATRDYVQAQHAAWGKLVREIGLRPE